MIVLQICFKFYWQHSAHGFLKQCFSKIPEIWTLHTINWCMKVPGSTSDPAKYSFNSLTRAENPASLRPRGVCGCMRSMLAWLRISRFPFCSFCMTLGGRAVHHGSTMVIGYNNILLQLFSALEWKRQKATKSWSFPSIPSAITS